MPNRAEKPETKTLGQLAWHTDLAGGVLDGAPMPMLVSDLDGTVVYANHAATVFFGVSYGVGSCLIELIPEPENNAGRLQLQRLLRGEVAAYSGEHQIFSADGSTRWMLVNATTMATEDTAHARCVVVQFSDTEHQHRAIETLGYAEDRFRHALESGRQGVWDHDGRTDTMYYSPMWRTLRGMATDEPVPINHEGTWLERVHPEDRQRVIDNIARMDRGEDGSDEIEYRERRADGQYIWILARGRAVEWNEQGLPLRTIGTDTDITRLKTIEMELAAEKERLRVTLDSIADGMISTDEMGHVVFMNPAAEQLTGYSSGEAMGREVRSIFALRDGVTGELQECPVAVCLAQDRPAHRDDDMILVGRMGTQRDIRCTAAPVRTPAGRVAGAVLVFQDVTQSRAMQRQLAHSANHDELTGLPNRTAFDRALNSAIETARSSQSRHCLLYIDLDHFKPVNDTAGHAAGDELLRQVGQTIRGVCREHDIAARIGGDEFSALLHDCSVTTGQAIADTIVRAIGSLLFEWSGRRYRIGASVGMTVISAEPASLLGYMGEADAACYAAKAAGRGIAKTYQSL